MIIINADDFGRSQEETDVVISCYRTNRITSTSAMVFMKDSLRAAALGRDLGIDVGLHVNFIQSFTGGRVPDVLRSHHERIIKFLSYSKYSLLIYNPALHSSFKYVYHTQVDEFVRLYNRTPSHIDGHKHQHLSTNMLLGRVIPAHERVRRNFSFWPGEKGVVNRSYRYLTDWTLARRYRLTDFFFSLQHCLLTNRLHRVFSLSAHSSVELMTHPANTAEYTYLMSDDFLASLSTLDTGTYASL